MIDPANATKDELLELIAELEQYRAVIEWMELRDNVAIDYFRNGDFWFYRDKGEPTTLFQQLTEAMKNDQINQW